MSQFIHSKSYSMCRLISDIRVDSKREHRAECQLCGHRQSRYSPAFKKMKQTICMSCKVAACNQQNVSWNPARQQSVTVLR